ncbi:hypothetical protein P3T76_013562 [Phytophthora citrophthora]|uniref:Uncharacterized protein n=1 Tax=Phytophthora citrophthora TaxID=4793 RepID=A0AAD9G3W8_9STRA|nr:hypothetical protein P3T76_013562 [Phytophthora citrophthora]
MGPGFVIMDADHVQYNACVAEIPHSTVLMCWFGVMQNVHKLVHDAMLDCVNRQLIFRNFYDLHFTIDEQQYLRKRDFVIASWERCWSDLPLIPECFEPYYQNFWLWRAFHTHSGYASKNNPLGTYRLKLKLFKNSKRATPVKLVSRLDLYRIAYESSMSPFSTNSSISKRMKAAYLLQTKTRP